MGLGIEVSIDRILVHSTALTFWAKALSLSPRRSRQGAMSSLTGPCQLCMSICAIRPAVSGDADVGVMACRSWRVI